MNVEIINQRMNEVLRLAASEEPNPGQIYQKALDAKRAIWALVNQLQYAVNTLDGIVPLKAPGKPWTFGWTPPPEGTTPQLVYAPQQAPTEASERARRVMDIVMRSVAAGRLPITTKEVADQLRREGDKGKAIETAVGNILNRSGKWRRVRRGEYEPIPEEVMSSQ